MNVKLVVVEGVRLGSVVPVLNERFLIGRDSGCQLRPKSPTISHQHCALTRRGDHVVVQDLGSTNGTLVNDHRLVKGEEIRVHDGDRLQVGQLIFIIQIDDEQRHSAGELPIGDWLSQSTGLDAPRDGGSQTAIVASPFGRPALPASNPQNPPETETIPRFVYRRFDPERKVASVGLGQDHLEENGSLGAIRKCLFEWASTPKYRRMVIDLDGVEKLSSAACAFLLGLAYHCQEAGGELRLCSIKPMLKKKLGALKLESRISCFDDRAEAIVEPWE
ncbi:hypothetical protein BH23PLA1_BH23PLA1_01270 [soil metagenome]